MDEDKCGNAAAITIERRPRDEQIRQTYNGQELLNIAKRIDQFVSDNGWSWCTMDHVYKILKAVHQ